MNTIKGTQKGADQSTNHKKAFVKVDTCLMEDLQKSGCPVCNHMEEVMFDFLATWQYTLINDENVQREFASERGFCPAHTWQLASMSSQRGISQGYPKLLEHFAGALMKIINGATNISEGIDVMVKDSADCRICQLLKNVEERYVRCLAALLPFWNRKKGSTYMLVPMAYACDICVCLFLL